MGETINFVTLYPKCHNPGLMKDVGQIPNTLGKMYDEINTELISCIVDINDDVEKNLGGMIVRKIPFVLNNDFLTGLLYIVFNAKKVDWFNFYHGGRKVYYWTKAYKTLNRKGHVYLKMDMSFEGCLKCMKSKKERDIFNNTAGIVDLISVESEAIQEKTRLFSTADIQLVCNGYIDNGILSIKQVSERDKAFITVSRLGTPPKATDVLLEAFAQTAAYHDWDLRLVGPIDDTFKPYIDDYYSRFPNLKHRVIFLGEIIDKAMLYDVYNSSRVFVLPSRWEGFPLVGPEALHCGCRMILSDVIPPIKELTDDGKYGIRVKANDVESLATAMIHEAQRNTIEKEPVFISEYAKRELSWDGICSKLYKMMKGKTS